MIDNNLRKGEFYMGKLNAKQLLSVSLTLFAIFFGAGNMIFPPAMGQLAGTNFIHALAGFLVTDAGIAILGMIGVVLVGNSMSDLGGLVSKKFAVVLSVGVYLLIGPLFALPRTGSVSFELALLPYVPQHNAWIFSLLFTAGFFLLTYYLSSNPNKVVDVVGKYMTPILLISIVMIFVGCIFTNPVNSEMIQYGTIGAPQQDYASIPFFKGMIEGYNALDGPAGLAFAIIVINAIRSYGITDKKSIVKYTIFSGLGAAFFLAVVYFMLTYAGAITSTSFSNGGALLHALTSSLFGNVGGVILGIAVLLACLTTSIGLTTAFSDYFKELFPSVSYKKIAAAVCIFSFVISNVGLSQLITISLPVLMMIYPISVVLILLSFMKKYIGHRRMVYIGGMFMAFLASFVSALESAGVSFGITSLFHDYLPFYSLGLGWIIPAVVGAFIGFLPFWPMNKKNENI